MPIRILRAIFCSSLFLVTATAANGQQVFDRKATTVNNMGLSVTNVGTFGRPTVRTQPAGLPSMEYPRGSGQEHLFEAGLWIGAVRDGSEIVVSTGAVTDPAGYSQGKAGYEFTNDGTVILQRSSLPNSPLFSPLAVSHEDLIVEYSDRRTNVGNIPVSGHTSPLFADVRMEVYSWNFGFAEYLSIVKVDIHNTATFDWDSVFVGMYADMVVRNVNTTVETGSAFFNKGGLGYLDSLHTLYVFDACNVNNGFSCDNPSVNSYGAMSILGAEYRGVEFHPRRADEVEAAGYRVPKVRPNFWLFSSGTGDFTRPVTDQDNYEKMALDFNLAANREKLRTDGQSGNGNYIQLISMGPFPKIAAGERVTVYFAFVTALKPQQFQNLSGKPVDTEASRVNLLNNVDWAYRLFDGQEVNGERVRFLVPEPPTVPKIRMELEAGRSVIYWDRSAEWAIDPVSQEADFEGYRLYRTNLGDDIRGTINTSSQLIREYDVPGNEHGFNTGFSQVLLNAPVVFADDTTEYWYRYEIDGMLNGWQYQFAVTAFDTGDEGVPSLETSLNANAIRVFPGTPVNESFSSDAEEFQVGVYPNPYRINAAWDGPTPFTRRLMFYNLPRRAEIRVYTLAGEIVATLRHDADTYTGDTRWFNDLSGGRRVLSGGEHAWDLLSDANQNLTTGLYLYSVKDEASGHIQTGKLVIIK